MEEILNKIIEIDNKSKEIVEFEKEKNAKLDEFIEKEFDTKKVVLDMEYKDNIEHQKEKSKKRLDDEKSKITTSIENEIETINQNYNEHKEEIIEKIVSKLKRLEE